MKRVTVLVSIILTFFMSSQALSASAWHKSRIKMIYPQAHGGFILTFEVNDPQCSNGSTPKYHYVDVGQNGVTEKGIDKLFSTALAAAASGKPITINFDSSVPQCYINRLYIEY